MNIIFLVSRIKWVTFIVLILFCNTMQSQNNLLGDWEGTFMNDFRVILRLNSAEDNSYSGKLMMFSGSNMIQNDEISDIILDGNNLKFFIKAKETQFIGSFNKVVTELSGNFIFPDASKHPLVVNKSKYVKPLAISSIKDFNDIRNKKYITKELKADYGFLIDKLKEHHPQMYSYSSEDSFDIMITNTNNNINSELTLEEYYKLIVPIVDNVKCSHTGMRLPNKYQQAINIYGNFLPIKLSIINNKAHYLSNYCNVDSEILPGSEVLSINKLPIKDIITSLQKYIPSEGNNMTTKYNELDKNFNSYYYLLDNSEIFDVEYLISGIEKKTISLPACSFNDFVLKEKPDSNLPVEFKIDEEKSVAFLKIRSFAFPDIEGYIQQMDDTFELLKNKSIQNLVIDLRDNKGGHPIFAAQLFSYLIEKDFIYFKPNPDVKEFEPLYKTMQNSEYSFKGKIYAFVNGGSLSTTGHLISLMKYHTNATFIGEEPGSSFYCNDQSMQVVLPNTGIEVNIPQTTFETAISGFNKNETFPIDYKVNNSLRDLLNGKDSYMELFYRIIE
ncbi:MAG: S41 family peptidase [Bacteroidota bacterium]